MRAITFTIAVALAMASSFLPVSAQETVKNLAKKASAEQQLMNAFQTLER